mmetsp:Transcript_68044/g.208592  ORF Transcript_68044/g.208592 Transcript_68044/m.208592 type:complete len:241 (-) Transcript_68044:498-1220(-)
MPTILHCGCWSGRSLVYSHWRYSFVYGPHEVGARTFVRCPTTSTSWRRCHGMSRTCPWPFRRLRTARIFRISQALWVFCGSPPCSACCGSPGSPPSRSPCASCGTACGRVARVSLCSRLGMAWAAPFPRQRCTRQRAIQRVRFGRCRPPCGGPWSSSFRSAMATWCRPPRRASSWDVRQWLSAPLLLRLEPASFAAVSPNSTGKEPRLRDWKRTLDHPSACACQRLTTTTIAIASMAPRR